MPIGDVQHAVVFARYVWFAMLRLACFRAVLGKDTVTFLQYCILTNWLWLLQWQHQGAWRGAALSTVSGKPPPVLNACGMDCIPCRMCSVSTWDLSWGTYWEHCSIWGGGCCQHGGTLRVLRYVVESQGAMCSRSVCNAVFACCHRCMWVLAAGKLCQQQGFFGGGV